MVNHHELPEVSWRHMLTPNGLIDLIAVESHDDRAVNDNHRSGHVTEVFEIGQSGGILRYVPLVELLKLCRRQEDSCH